MKQQSSQLPVVVDQLIELNIDNYGHEGEGVGRFEGLTIFVPGALQGEQIIARVTEVKKNYARAAIVRIESQSAERTEPMCAIYGECGGCQLQHLDYQAQLRMKREQVVTALERIGGLNDVTVHATLGMPEPWYYRNKVQYPVGMVDGSLAMGFYRKGTHQIVAGYDCWLQTAVTNQIAKKVKDLVEQYQLSAYNEQTGSGFLRHVLIRKGFKTGEIMVVLIANGVEFPAGGQLAHDLMASFPAIKSVVQNINLTRGNTILGKETRVLGGTATINDEIGGLRFKISPRSFFQVNPVQTEVLYQKAVDYAGLKGTETVVDAYCGVGSLSLFLARRAKWVYGIEVIPEAIRDAAENAAVNKITNVDFSVGKTEVVLPDLLKQGIKIDVATVDPPRAGCEASVLKSLADAEVAKIVYVSCNPATLARDLKLLAELGYQTLEVQPVDMFPQTYHVECVTLMSRAKG